MALYPGRQYVGTTVRLDINLQNEDGTDIDPATLTLKTMSPSGVEATYTYADTDISKSSVGDYFCEVVPDMSGRWHYRWISTGSGTSIVIEGSFVVQASVFEEDWPRDYGR